MVLVFRPVGLPLKERLVKLTVRNIHTGTTNQLAYYLAVSIEGDGSIIRQGGEIATLAKRRKRKNSC